MIERLRSPACIVLALTWIFYLHSHLRLDRASRGGNMPTEIVAIDTLATSLRRAIANILWVRVDDYLHASDVVSSKKGEQGGVRPVLGVSAQISAAELFPLARLVVTLDPSFIRAGMVVGASMLRGSGRTKQATELLLGMIRANPDHPRVHSLYHALGIDRWQKGDYKKARPYLLKAAELYERVLDPRALLRAGEPPLDDLDAFTYRATLAGLVQTLVILEDYEPAVKYWKLSTGFDPKNKVVQVLARYMAQKQQGKVDRDDLALFYQKLTRDEQEQLLAKAKANPGKEVPAEIMASAKEQTGLDRKPQATEFIALGLPNRQLAKLITIWVTIFALGAHGWHRRWLVR